MVQQLMVPLHLKSTMSLRCVQYCFWQDWILVFCKSNLLDNLPFPGSLSFSCLNSSSKPTLCTVDSQSSMFSRRTNKTLHLPRSLVQACQGLQILVFLVLQWHAFSVTLPILLDFYMLVNLEPTLGSISFLGSS